MQKLRVFSVPLVVAAIAAVGCGGKSSVTSKAGPSAGASPNPYGQSGGYGQTSGAPSSASPTALITTKRDPKLGTILAYGPKRLTVYLFAADRAGMSSCTGACASVWPPVTGVPKAEGAAISDNLGTITRPDGTRQVTYRGHPLYRYVRDKDEGDSYGEALKQFGAEWYVLAPTGKKVDVS